MSADDKETVEKLHEAYGLMKEQLAGVIVGKALYRDEILLSEAIRIAGI